MSKNKILIVEDEAALRKVLVDLLTDEPDYEVLEAKNGVEGLAMAVKHHPDIILLDIIMPRMDGMTMLKELRQDEWGKNAHVILLTNVGGPDKLTEAAQSGAYEYFVKTDIDLDDVIQRVKNHLDAGPNPL